MEISSLSSSAGAASPEVVATPEPVSTGSASSILPEKQEGIPVSDPISSTGGIVDTQA
ncbi:hypothetical protein [Leptospira sanjuanensis]|uniref:hypothetical protein n=1 Tax=Leptospira sanjuanensis TaxID=2879643 RepID=UPI001EE8BCF8|nr:hypothetical protein [Leptospira sanjuanensis]MCG6167759.1 hypothetical protein [Leptospira sanjuanensis]